MSLPDPPVPVDCDLRDLQWMPLDVARLRDSELAAMDGEVFRVAVLSWCASWHQVPAASLPDDDAALARLLGFGRDIKGWKKVRAAGGLRGWAKHTDGRLYHPVVAAKALEANAQKRRAATKRERDADRLRRWREQQEETRHETDIGNSSETTNETRFVAERQDSTLPDLTLPDRTASPPSGHGDGGRRRVDGFHRENLRKAVNAGSMIDVLRACRANISGDRMAEWERDCGGLQIAAVASILWLAHRKRKPIREPSGMRAARIEWGQYDQDARREAYEAMAADLRADK